MVIGVPKEIKPNENRVVITPAGVGLKKADTRYSLKNGRLAAALPNIPGAVPRITFALTNAM